MTPGLPGGWATDLTSPAPEAKVRGDLQIRVQSWVWGETSVATQALRTWYWGLLWV